MTQRREIALGIGTAARQREHMVYLLGGCQSTSLLAFLAERVRLDEAVADTLPCTTISFVGFRLALEMIVMIIRLSLMLRAVKTACQLRTAGMLAWSLWFSWHDVTSSWT